MNIRLIRGRSDWSRDTQDLQANSAHFKKAKKCDYQFDANFFWGPVCPLSRGQWSVFSLNQSCCFNSQKMSKSEKSFDQSEIFVMLMMIKTIDVMLIHVIPEKKTF